jgi:hypothetical protein
MASSINASTSGAGGVITTADNTGILNIQTAGTTAVTIDASQRAAFVAGTAALPAITTTGDTNTGIFFSAADTIDFAEGGTAVGQFDSSSNFKFNSGYGSVATAYGCRAWVNFDGQGTVAIRASGNVSSITDNGTGNYTINFTNAMPDANYASVCMQNDYAFTSSAKTIITGSGAQTEQTTSSFKIYSGQISDGVAGSAFDAPCIRVAIFR